MAAVNGAYRMSPGSLPPRSMEQHFEELEGPEKEYAMYNDTSNLVNIRMKNVYLMNEIVCLML